MCIQTDVIKGILVRRQKWQLRDFRYFSYISVECARNRDPLALPGNVKGESAGSDEWDRPRETPE